MPNPILPDDAVSGYAAKNNKMSLYVCRAINKSPPTPVREMCYFDKYLARIRNGLESQGEKGGKHGFEFYNALNAGEQLVEFCRMVFVAYCDNKIKFFRYEERMADEYLSSDFEEHQFIGETTTRTIKGLHSLAMREDAKFKTGLTVEPIGAAVDRNKPYKGVIKLAGKTDKTSSFFPDNWSKALVIRYIIMAYSDFLENSDRNKSVYNGLRGGLGSGGWAGYAVLDNGDDMIIGGYEHSETFVFKEVEGKKVKAKKLLQGFPRVGEAFF